MSQYAFSFDVSRCSGCMACVVACQDQNDFAADDVVAFRHVTKYEAGAVPLCPNILFFPFLPALRGCPLPDGLSHRRHFQDDRGRCRARRP